MNKNRIYYVISGSAAIILSFSNKTTSIMFIAVFIAAAFLLCIIYFKNDRMKITFMLLILILFFLRTEWVEHTNVTNVTGQEETLNGIVHDGPYRDGNQAQFEWINDSSEKMIVRVSLQDSTDIPLLKTLSPGTPCRLQGELIRPSPPDNFHAFDYRHYLKTQYIHWTFEVSSLKDMKCGKNVSKHPFYLLKKWRHHGVEWIDTSFPSELKGIASALLFGERHLLDAETEDHYQKLGLIHLLAVSGLHVGLITTTVYFILIRFGITREIAGWILVSLLPMYIVAAGAAPSVIRAATMVMLFILWKKTGMKRVDPFSMLSLFALLLLFVNPYYIFQVGFQLSFLISGALLLSWPLLKSKRKREVAVFVTCIAQLAALPVIVYHFYEFSFLSFILNLLFVPFVSFVVLPSMFILFILSFLSPFLFSKTAVVLAFIVEKAHQFLEWSASWNGLQFLFGKPSIFILCVFSILIFYLFYRVEKYGISHKLFLPLALLTGVFIIQIMVPYFDKNGYITILDVGQGDSILIELPHRKAVYLIDGGGVLDFPKEDWEVRNDPYDTGDRVVVPFLKAKGIQSIDKVIVTHGDIDHYGGLYKTAEEVKIREVVYGKGEEFKDEEKQFLQFLHNERQVPITWSKEGDSWKVGESSFQVLMPEGNENTGNDRSIVIRAVIGEAEWLFTGDLEEEGERKLLQKYPGVTADLLKVGHHGSKTSTTKSFARQLQPKAAFISAGTCNRFGHPHEETLSTLKEIGTNVYRTDVNGAIQVTFDQEKVINIKQAKPNTNTEENNCS